MGGKHSPIFELCVMMKISDLQIKVIVKKQFFSLGNNTPYIYVIELLWTV